jgi:hypothetical protein
MRKAILIIASILISYHAITQNQKWEVYLGQANKNTVPNDIIESYDKGLLLGTVQWVNLSQTVPLLLKANTNGELLYDQVLNHSDGKVDIISVTQDSDGNLYAGGMYRLPNNPTGIASIFKFNPCGEPVWCKYLPVPTGSYDGWVQDVIINNNNELIALVNQSTGGQTDQIYLAAFDLNGNELWIRPYATKIDYPLMVNQFGYKLIEHNDGYYIAGKCYYPFPNNPDHVFLRPLFIGINSSFHEKWVKPIAVLDSVFGEARSLLPLSDSVIIGIGHRILGSPNKNSLIMLLSTEGEELNYFQIPNEALGSNIVFNVIREFERINDTLFLSPVYMGLDTQTKHFGEMVFDQSGVVHKNSIRGIYSPNGTSTKISDNHFVIAMPVQNFSQFTQILLYKINADLETVPFDTTQFVYDSLCPHQIQPGTIDLTDCPPTVSIDELPSPDQYYESIRWIPIKAYPNPVKEGKLTLEFDNTRHHQNMELHCYDNFGRLVHSRKIYHGQQDTVLDVSTWPPGIYIAVVYSDGSARGKAKFVVR